MLHAVSESVLSAIQYRYLPLPINSLIKGIVRMGVRCNPAGPKGMSYLIGQLLPSRKSVQGPFFSTGVDPTSPFCVYRE